MNKPGWVRGALILAMLVLVGLGYIQLDDNSTPGDPASIPAEPTHSGPVVAPAHDGDPGARPLWVEGPDGRTDLAPTLERIARGEKHPHRNDGSVFQNRERRLPIEPRGYYREFVHPTPGQRGPGAQRLVVGKQGEVYYTPDHYETFERVDATLRLDG